MALSLIVMVPFIILAIINIESWIDIEMIKVSEEILS